MLYLFLSLPKSFNSNFKKTYHWFLITDRAISQGGGESLSHFCCLHLKSKIELNKCLSSSLATSDGFFIAKNFESTLTFAPSQTISIQKNFVFVPSRYKNKFDLFTLNCGPFISEICNALNLQ
ncbi:MAG: hypothetical protein A2X86_05480 [Bdellovibrionales bacterium GWA2_49_15]|nr:MAG: hypothetical protein A2X86_05480 [Bdellovibrionales bacterium GWA2_49_15]